MRFSTLFMLKKLHLGPIWTGKYGFITFFVFAKIFAKILQKTCVRTPVVVDYADTVSVWSLTTLTPCLRIRDFRTLGSIIFAKTKKLFKPFLSVHMGWGPGGILCISKKMVKIWWHCPFKVSNLLDKRSGSQWANSSHWLHPENRIYYSEII